MDSISQNCILVATLLHCSSTVTHSTSNCITESKLKSRIGENQVIEILDEAECPKKLRTSDILVINLDDDDDMEVVVKETDPVKIDAITPENHATDVKNHGTNAENHSSIRENCAATPESYRVIWWYKDPKGNCQGPYPLCAMSDWKEKGYFDDDFKVWRSGQCEADGILLADALRHAVEVDSCKTKADS